MIDLVEHPETRRTDESVALAIRAQCTRTENGDLAVEFHLTGNGADLALPPPGESVFAEGLWKRTCFEVFVRHNDSSAYFEYNLSPSSAWALFSFRGYGSALRRDERSSRLPGYDAGVALRIGLSAVIEQADGAIRYWALRHPAARPDFHHADSFALTMEAESEA